jgi:hypothetical protein
MGMPVITPGEGSRTQAITDLIQSVALQEAALAHMMNAEGEKMQKIIAMDDVSIDELMKLNKSVTQLVSAISRLEMMFVAKLELFSDEQDEPV